MTVIHFPRTAPPPPSALERALAEEGAFRVLVAAVKALIKERKGRRELKELPDELLYDIGLIKDGDPRAPRRGP